MSWVVENGTNRVTEWLVLFYNTNAKQTNKQTNNPADPIVLIVINILLNKSVVGEGKKYLLEKKDQMVHKPP